MITEGKKQTIKLVIAVFALVIIIAFACIMMMKYEVEGETNMPFKLSKIMIIGTAEGVEREETTDNKQEVKDEKSTENGESKEDNADEKKEGSGDNKENNLKWDFSIYQNNDIYFYIDQNEEVAQEDLLIKNVEINNIQVVKAPKKGTIQAYMPNSEAGRLYSYNKQFLVQDSLTYKGASQSSSTNLEIGSKGGTAWIRFSNTAIGDYSSDKDKEIVHDGSLLEKIKVANEEINFEVSFDFIIETTQNKYKANINLQLPTGDLAKEKTCYLEKTDMSDVIFKRVSE